MKSPHILLLGSKSASRKMLLNDAGIAYHVVDQDANESLCDWGLPFQRLVEHIASYKMEHVVMPPGTHGEIAYVLTADTLSQDAHGVITGKPADAQEAIAMIKAARDGMRSGTAFCLERKKYNNGRWHTDARVMKFVDAHYTFVIPDGWIELYLEKSLGLTASGSIAIEQFGGLFLKSVHGSYTAIVGLPLYELREALTALGFFA